MKVYKAPEHVVHILDLSIYLVWSGPMFWSRRFFCQTLPLNDCVNNQKENIVFQRALPFSSFPKAVLKTYFIGKQN